MFNINKIKFKAFLICAAVAVPAVFVTSGGAMTAAAEGKVSACIAMEQSTRTVLYEENADRRLPMASTTKIMTALIVCEDCDPDTVVRVPDEAVGTEGSSIYLKRGEEIDVCDLLYGLMLRSGNDAAVALAVIHSGSERAFADRMNEKAKQLGANDTHFTNPNGLPDDNHYTTARDLCAISCAAMENGLFRQIAGSKSWHGRYRSFSNKNKMLYNYDGANGIKTGYTLKAGRCLVSSARRGKTEVVCVVLNEYDMYGRSAAVLDRCFENYALCALPGDKVFMCGGIPCKAKSGHSFVVPLKGRINIVCEASKSGKHCKKGDHCGNLKIYSGNSLIFKTKLYSII